MNKRFLFFAVLAVMGSVVFAQGKDPSWEAQQRIQRRETERIMRSNSPNNNFNNNNYNNNYNNNWYNNTPMPHQNEETNVFQTTTINGGKGIEIKNTTETDGKQLSLRR